MGILLVDSFKNSKLFGREEDSDLDRLTKIAKFLLPLLRYTSDTCSQ